MAIRITGEVSDRETEEIVRRIHAQCPPGGKVRIFLKMSHYASFNSAEDLYYDLRFARYCDDRIERLAVVGDRSWKSTLVGLFGLFSSIETAYFDQSEARNAWQWLVGSDAANEKE